MALEKTPEPEITHTHTHTRSQSTKAFCSFTFNLRLWRGGVALWTLLFVCVPADLRSPLSLYLPPIRFPCVSPIFVHRLNHQMLTKDPHVTGDSESLLDEQDTCPDLKTFRILQRDNLRWPSASFLQIRKLRLR